MNVLILGLGESGLSAAKYLINQGSKVTGVDKKTVTLQGLRFFDESSFSLQSLYEYDQVIVSPGISPEHPIYIEANRLGKEIIGEAELAFRSIKNPVLGITGTNGKTTVTELTTHVLKTSGIPATAIGNVGYPLTEWLLKGSTNEVLVAELSSFQLETLSTKVLNAAVNMNITPDHLDRYPSMVEYAKAKCRIGNCLKPGAPLILYKPILDEYKELIQTSNLITFGTDQLCDYVLTPTQVYMGGKLLWESTEARLHDRENEVASYVLCKTQGVTVDQFKHALKSFKKPDHRIQFVSSYNGVDYYDDSKGTNIDAVIKAVESFSRPILLIAGGVDKGASYAPWITPFKQKVREILVIGEAAEKIEQEMAAHVVITRCKSLQEAVKGASERAQMGDVVLLSPGCSSYDMFLNYKDRGEKFQQYVHEVLAQI